MDSLAHMAAVMDMVLGTKSPSEELLLLAQTKGPYQASFQRILAYVERLHLEIAALHDDESNRREVALRHGKEIL